ncbi:MAG: hypothetical protein BGP16_06195 [Sphingobium sp. 66-54]|nr:MAG: hypothetical protein BGP16_06195 [Sphingobium sp. 66-54]
MAVAPYVRPDDPPRTMWCLSVDSARVDVRDAALWRALDIDPADSAVPWQPQLAEGICPATWTVSDGARRAGADGLIYTARSDPRRWHLVLFRWNEFGGPVMKVAD